MYIPGVGGLPEPGRYTPLGQVREAIGKLGYPKQRAAIQDILARDNETLTEFLQLVRQIMKAVGEDWLATMDIRKTHAGTNDATGPLEYNTWKLAEMVLDLHMRASQDEGTEPKHAPYSD